MGYDAELWNKYSDENKDNIQNEFSKFIYFLSLGLGAKKICEAGCNIGNNLSSFPENLDVFGIDMNKKAIEKAKNQYPHFSFKQTDIKQTGFSDSSFDLVFTRGVLIHISTDELDSVMKELLRISKKWILNFEYFGEDGKMIKWKRGDDLLWYRNMKERWKNFDVKIINDVDIPKEIDPGKMKLTLVTKNQ